MRQELPRRGSPPPLLGKKGNTPTTTPLRYGFVGQTKGRKGMKKTLITTSIIAALFAVPAFADPTAQELLDQKTVTSKYYVDTTKQDKITTDKVLFLEADGKVIQENIYVPAIVSTNAAGTQLNGNTIGVLDYSTYATIDDSAYSDLRYYNNSSYDNFVPTVRAVANELCSIWTILNNTLYWTSTQTSAVNAYSVSNGGGTNQWLSDDFRKYITGSSLAQGLALKQNIIAAGTSGNVVTYTGTAGQVGSVGVYNGSTTYNSSTDSGKLATAGFVETKLEKLTCAGYVPGHENDIDYCWLYGDVQVAAAACLEYDETATSASQCCSGVLQSDKNSSKCGCNSVSDCTNACVRPQTHTCSVDKVCTCA